MPDLDRRAAAGIVEQALQDVFDPAVVRTLREDSPLTVLGVTPADAICISDAVAQAAPAFGRRCVLGDAELGAARTVSDLVDAVVAAAVPETPEDVA